MIQLDYLKGRNYVTFKKFEIPLKQQGLIRLKGFNKDAAEDQSASNGAGKTVLLEALQFILFGVTARGSKNDDLVRGKNLCLELAFSKGDQRYVIKQYRKHKTHKNKLFIFKNGKDISPTQAAAARRYVLDLFNLTKEEFFNSVFLSPRVSSVFLDGSPKEKADCISKLFSLEAYDELKDKIKIESQEHSKKIIALATRSEDLEELEQKIKALPSLKVLKNEIEAGKKEKERLVSKISKKERNVARLNLKLEQALVRERASLLIKKLGGPVDVNDDYYFVLQNEMGKLLALTRKKLDQQLGLVQQAKRSEELVKRLKNLPKITSSKKALNQELTRLKKNYDNGKEAKVIQKKLKNRSVLNATDLKKLSIKYQKLMRKEAQLEQQLQDAEKNLKHYAVLDASNCPACLRPLNRKEVQKKLRFLQETQETLQQKLNALKEKIPALKTKYTQAQKTLPLIERFKELEPALKLNTKQLKQRLKDHKQLIVLRDTRRSLEEELKVLTKLSLGSTKKGLASLREQEIIFVEKISIVKELVTLLSSHKIEKSKTINYTGVKEKQQRENDTLKKLRPLKDDCIEQLLNEKHRYKKVSKLHKRYVEMDQQRQDIQKTKYQISLFKLLEEYLGVAKITKIKELCGVLNEALAEYASLLFTEQDLTFDLNYESLGLEFIVRKKDIAYPIKFLSEGERSRLNICFIFALKTVISSGKKLDLIILDEIDRHLDPLGRHVLVNELLPQLTQTCGTLFMVSHEETIKDKTFDQVWTVLRKNNKSELTI